MALAIVSRSLLRCVLLMFVPLGLPGLRSGLGSARLHQVLVGVPRQAQPLFWPNGADGAARVRVSLVHAGRRRSCNVTRHAALGRSGGNAPPSARSKSRGLISADRQGPRCLLTSLQVHSAEENRMIGMDPLKLLAGGRNRWPTAAPDFRQS